MTDKTEAQPEALRLAESIDPLTRTQLDNLTLTCAATELRFQHAEIQEVKAQLSEHKAARMAYASEFPPDADGEADVGNVHANIRALKAQLVAQTNRAASAEQQVTALNHRLDMANRLNTDARNQLAQLSARQAAPDAIGHVRIDSGEVHIYPRNRDSESSGLIDGQLVYAAAPPAHEREPRTDEWHHNSRVESAAGIRDALSRMGVHLTITTILQLVDITRTAHGIGATND